MNLDDQIRKAVNQALPKTKCLLSRLVQIPSLSGAEQEAMQYLFQEFGRLEVQPERVALSNDLKADPDYSDPLPQLDYDGRFNLSVVRPGSGGGPKLLLNTHADVVPPSDGMDDPWSGRVENGIVYGRGACDAKGQVATIFLVLMALDAMGIQLAGDLAVHLVVEEENGGNGTLAMIRRAEKADACVVLEPSAGRLHTSIRGAVWFRLIFHGKAGHSGEATQTRSALLIARDAMAILERCHAELLESSQGFELFDVYPNPMPLTFGRLQAGNWPATAPSRAILDGVLGFLPNMNRETIADEILKALLAHGDPFLPGTFELSFMYRHDCSVLDPKHPLPQILLASAREAGSELTVSGMTASCDAWFYNNHLRIPTVVYGPGALKFAHSKDEQISLSEIALAAEVLLRLAISYCGEKV